MSPAPTGGHATPRSGIAIIGTGSAVPKRQVTNADLEACMDTSDEWIVQRTGIRTRHIHDPKSGESTESLATEAARNALDAAGITADQLDLIVCGTMTPDMPTPSIANLLTGSLGARPIPAFDLNAACSGFVYAMNTAHALMTTAPYTTALVLGVDCVTKFCKFSNLDRSSAVLFGDAGGACVLSATGDPSKGLIAQAMHSDGAGATVVEAREEESPIGVLAHAARSDTIDHAKLLWMGESYNPDFEDNRLFLKMYGRKLYNYALTNVPGVVRQSLERAGLELADVKKVFLHQANAKMDEAILVRLFRLYDAGRPDTAAVMPMSISWLGNSSVATVPTLLDLGCRGEMNDHELSPGDIIVLASVGAGMNINSVVYRWV